MNKRGKMRNRAKCKLCQEVIESVHIYDRVICSCKEICINGGTQEFYSSARNFCNFLRVDDNDNELEVQFDDLDPDSSEIYPDKKENEASSILKHVDHLIAELEQQNPSLMSIPMNQYDCLSILLLLQSTLKTLTQD